MQEIVQGIAIVGMLICAMTIIFIADKMTR